MKKIILPVLIAALALITGITAAQIETPAEPTQTPYIIYVVVTATPEPEPEPVETEEVITISRVTEEPVIQRPTSPEMITIVNNDSAGAATTGDLSIANDYATSTEDLIQRIVSTVMAQTSTTAGGTSGGTTSVYSGTGGGMLVRNSDGSTCSASFELVSEPSYGAGAIVPRGQVFWKEWQIRNTGTCTWTADWEFVFDSGWQIGNTRFHMNRTTAPGETLLVRLAMVPDQKQNGNYYSTYAFEAPDGTQFGKITSSYTVQDPSYFAPKPTIPADKLKPQHGREAGPVPCWPYASCPPRK